MDVILKQFVIIAKKRHNRESGQGWSWGASSAMAEVNPGILARGKNHGIFCCVPAVNRKTSSVKSICALLRSSIILPKKSRDCIGLVGASVALVQDKRSIIDHE